jgi:hypothetical protein
MLFIGVEGFGLVMEEIRPLFAGADIMVDVQIVMSSQRFDLSRSPDI